MAGIQYHIDVERAEMLAFFESKLSRMENLRPFYVNVGEHLLNSVEDRFDTQTAPDGTAWTALAPATVANRLRRHGNAPLTILRERGRLAGSFNYDVSPRQVSIGTPVVYAAIQHFGGEAGRNKKVTIPPRPVLGMSPQDETIISEMAEDFLRS